MPDLCMGLGSGCRAPNLQVLAMDLTRTPNLAEGLLASAGARLQHLQVVIEGPGYQMWPPSDPKLDQLWEGGFWSAVKAFPDLAALQLFLQPNCFDGPTPGKQVLSNKHTHCPAELNALGAWLPQGVLSVAGTSCTELCSERPRW